MNSRSFGVFEFFFAAPVAVFLDETAGFGEFGLGVDVGESCMAFVLRQSAKEAGAVQMHVG